MAKRKRDVPVLFYVSKDEMALIQQKMQAFGTSNMSAYLRSSRALSLGRFFAAWDGVLKNDLAHFFCSSENTGLGSGSLFFLQSAFHFS